MKENRRLLVFFVVLLVVASTLVMVKPAFAQTTPKPSVPQFSVEVNKSTIVVTIKNQPLPSTINDVTAELHYNIQVKADYQNNWEDVYSKGLSYGYHLYTEYIYPIQSTSEYTTLSISTTKYPFNTELDIRVQALIANMTEVRIPNFYPFMDTRYHGPDEYTYEQALETMSSSEWSPAQTLTITDADSSTSINNSPSPVPTKMLSPTATPYTNENNQPLTNNSKDASVPFMTFLLVVMVFTIIIIGLSLMLLKSRIKALASNQFKFHSY
jgi:hypothetical protein